MKIKSLPRHGKNGSIEADLNRRECYTFYKKAETGKSVDENGDENELRVKTIPIVSLSRRRSR
jgi:hypothetical protein